MRPISILSIILLLAGGFSVPAEAIETKAIQAIIVDDTTGTVLFEKNADTQMHPSSMSKLMTVYMVFTRLKEGRLKLDDTLPVSEKAWRMQGSKSWVELGNRVKVEDLLRGIIVQSGNDACVVIAEGLSGSEEAFANEMNRMAKEIGLTHSHFVNSTGWPDEKHWMTARDLATLSHRLIHDFPQYYHYFAEREFTYHNIKQPNRNVLLNSDLGVDGLKTGHTEQAGYGIAISAKNPQGRRAIVVVNGLTSEKERAQEAEALMRTAFRDFENVPLLTQGEKVDAMPVWFGEKHEVSLVAPKNIVATLPRVNRSEIRFVLRYEGPAIAPIKAGAELAILEITVPGRSVMKVPLVAGENVPELSGARRIIPALSYYITGE